MTLFFFLVLVSLLGLIVCFPSGFDDPVVLQGTTNFDLMRPPWSIVLASLVSGFRSHLSRFFSGFTRCVFFRKFLSLWRV